MSPQAHHAFDVCRQTWQELQTLEVSAADALDQYVDHEAAPPFDLQAEVIALRERFKVLSATAMELLREERMLSTSPRAEGSR